MLREGGAGVGIGSESSGGPKCEVFAGHAVPLDIVMDPCGKDTPI